VWNRFIYYHCKGGTIYVAMIIPVEQPAWYIRFSQGRKPLVPLMCSIITLFCEFTFARIPMESSICRHFLSVWLLYCSSIFLILIHFKKCSDLSFSILYCDWDFADLKFFLVRLYWRFFSSLLARVFVCIMLFILCIFNN
jgi:hypothetical protein